MEEKEHPGQYDGPLHSEGGIPVLVDGTRPVEVEGEEYLICNEAYYSDEVLEFKQKTNLEVLDSIHGEFSCKFDQGHADSGDFILCRLVVNDPAKHDRKGTVLQILDAMQNEKSCRVSNGKLGDGKKLEDGGKMAYDLQIPSTLLEQPITVELAKGGTLDNKVFSKLFNHYKTEAELAQKWGVSLKKVEDEVIKGMKDEAEHSNIRKVQRIIALQHLEHDINYYEKTKNEIGGGIDDMISNFRIPNTTLPQTVSVMETGGMFDEYLEEPQCSCEEQKSEWADFEPTESQKAAVLNYSIIPSSKVVVAWKLIPFGLIELEKNVATEGAAKIEQLKKAIEGNEEIPVCIANYEGGKIKLLDGHHRHEAYKQAGEKYLPCAITIEVDAELPAALMPYKTEQEFGDGGELLDEDNYDLPIYIKVVDAEQNPVIGWAFNPLSGSEEQKTFMINFCDKHGYAMQIISKEEYDNLVDFFDTTAEEGLISEGNSRFLDKFYKELMDSETPDLFAQSGDEEFKDGGEIGSLTLEDKLENLRKSQVRILLKLEV
jgi:hypothetical protein